MILDTHYGAASNSDGAYIIGNVPPGTYTLRATMIGYQPLERELVVSQRGVITEVFFKMEPQNISLSEVIVTPGQFSLMRKDPVMRQILTEDDIHTIPQMGEDVYRAIRRIPGVSGNDYSAKFTIRGGEHEEVLVMLDGQELYEPFHLKDVNGGVLSIVDVMTIGGINLMTGSFPAEYGDHMSGVFDIKSIEPNEQANTSVGISFMNARLMSHGSFNDGKGKWLFSARRGYLDVVLALVAEDDDIVPRYSDVFGKFKYALNEKNILSINLLNADDEFKFLNDNNDLIKSSYGNSYAWLTHSILFNPDLTASSILSVGQVTGEREGIEFKPEDVLLFEVSDDRKFDFVGFKQDWKLTKGNKHLLSWGIDLKKLDADYDYSSKKRRFEEGDFGEVITIFDTSTINIDPDGNEFGIYFSERFRISPLLIAEGGIRYDNISHTSDNNISPRLNLLYRLGPKSNLRLGWGRFFQSQGINELDVEYGSQIFYRAQLAERAVVGFDHLFQNGIDLRIEAYHIKLSRSRPRFDNLSTQVLAFPELAETSILLEPEGGVSKGIEIYLKKDLGGKFSWWGSYGLAWAEEKIDGVDVPKDFDQRHTIYLDTNFRPNPNWRINLAWQYRSGWPYSLRVYVKTVAPDGIFPFEETYGVRNGLNLPTYHRMDLRVNKYFKVGKNRMSTFLNIINLYNRENVQARDFESKDIGPDGEVIAFGTRDELWFPLLPSIGISLDF